MLADIAKQYGIEWEQKGTHEEHLDVYNFKKKERKKEVQALEQEKEYLTAENEGLTAQIAESKADIQLLKEDKEQAVRCRLPNYLNMKVNNLITLSEKVIARV